MTLTGNWAAETTPLKLAAVIAYGTDVNCCRGVSVKKLFAPFVLTAISSQLLPLAKTLPQSTSVVNKPFVTPTAEFVTGPPSTLPFVGES